MTDDEAKQLLKQLSEHFREPVMPISRYCSALEKWQSNCHDRATRLRAELFPGIDGAHDDPTTKEAWEKYRTTMADKSRTMDLYKQGKKPTRWDHSVDDLRRYESVAEQISYVFMQIRKSSFLGRFLYGREKFRTKMCPQHKGTWSGLEHDKNVCPHECHLTGWIYEGQES